MGFRAPVLPPTCSEAVHLCETQFLWLKVALPGREGCWGFRGTGGPGVASSAKHVQMKSLGAWLLMPVVAHHPDSRHGGGPGFPLLGRHSRVPCGKGVPFPPACPLPGESYTSSQSTQRRTVSA